MNDYLSDEEYAKQVRAIERDQRKAEEKEAALDERLRREVKAKIERTRLKEWSYAGRLLAWRVATGDWRYVAYGRRGVGLAIAGGRKRLATGGYIDASGVPTQKGIEWVGGHAIDLSDWSVVPVPLSLAERARVAGKASAAKLTPEERTARARKAGLVRGAQLSKRGGDSTNVCGK